MQLEDLPKISPAFTHNMHTKHITIHLKAEGSSAQTVHSLHKEEEKIWVQQKRCTGHVPACVHNTGYPPPRGSSLSFTMHGQTYSNKDP